MTGMAGKKVLITGTSRGIGLAIAREFLSGGAEVFGTATTKTQSKDFAGFCIADFSDRSGIQKCVDFVNEIKPNIVINNVSEIVRSFSAPFSSVYFSCLFSVIFATFSILNV